LQVITNDIIPLLITMSTR